MRAIRVMLLVFIALVPLVTLVHRDDLGRWDVQRSAMAAPDEFSYLLMARHFLAGGGLSLQSTLGRDTFYPPGYPLLLAGWTKFFFAGKLTAFAAHQLNALLLCIDALCAYVLARRVLVGLSGEGGERGHRRFFYGREAAGWLALVIAAIFATNWHVLETSLFVMSEPLFMLVTFLWLGLALAWPEWYTSAPRIALLTLLAVMAWSIRGAGIVCVVLTIGFPLWMWARDLRPRGTQGRVRLSIAQRIGPLLIAILLPLAYQVVVTVLSPEKSVTSGEESANSYPRQLMTGLTDRQKLHFSKGSDYPALAANLGKMVLEHFNGFASTFVPWPRENPDMHFRDVVGKIFGFFALAGWLYRMTLWNRRGPEPTRFAAAYVLLYMGLYLVWPFNFARFWSPILPVMLAFGADAVIRFAWTGRRAGRWRAVLAGGLLALLLLVGVQEDRMQLANYARRLNYVSDSLREAVRAMIRAAPDPQRAIIATMGGDDQFTLAWYFAEEDNRRNGFSPYVIRAPRPHLIEAGKGGPGRAERPDEMLRRLLPEVEASAGVHMLFFSYFPNADTRDALASFRREAGGQAKVKKIFQKEIIATVWEIRAEGQAEGEPATRSR